MVRFVRGLVLVLLASMSAGSLAAQGGIKLGFVNSRAILQAAPGYAKAESLYTAELASYRVEVQKMQATFDSAAQAFEQSSVVLSPTARAAKRKELEGQQQTLERRMEELQQKASTRERELLEPIQTKVNGVIENIRASGNYAIIFDVGSPGSGIVAADRSLDLTQRVIDALKTGGS